jgi:hypothetical protein
LKLARDLDVTIEIYASFIPHIPSYAALLPGFIKKRQDPALPHDGSPSLGPGVVGTIGPDELNVKGMPTMFRYCIPNLSGVKLPQSRIQFRKENCSSGQAGQYNRTFSYLMPSSRPRKRSECNSRHEEEPSPACLLSLQEVV